MLDVMSRLQDVLRGSPINVDRAFIFEGGDFSLNTLLQLNKTNIKLDMTKNESEKQNKTMLDWSTCAQKEAL